MKKIDMNTWERKEIFDFFSNISNPFYMVSFIIDVTELKAFTKRHGCSFYYSLIYLCGKAMQGVENFCYTYENDSIYLIDERDPSFTDRKPGSELFHIVTIPAGENILDFCKAAAEASQNQKGFINPETEGANLAYYSCLPTLRMTALTNEFDVKNPQLATENIPRITWGKYTEQNGRLELTMSLEVNHRYIDGIHIEKFAANLERIISELAGK